MLLFVPETAPADFAVFGLFYSLDAYFIDGDLSIGDVEFLDRGLAMFADSAFVVV